jgi:hypothetical protein
LHRQDDEVAAVGDHSREGDVPDERRAGRDHHLGQAGASREQIIAVCEAVLLNEGAGMVREVLRDRARGPVRDQPLAEEQDERDRAHHERDAGEREREVAEAARTGVVRVLGGDHVDR